MKKYLFLYKENTGDRDEVKYIKKDLFSFECGHYFGGLSLTGACFSESLRIKEIDFKKITTILKKEDFEKLAELQEQIEKLGYGIEKNDERYKQGIEIQKEARVIIEKLQSKKNKELFEKVQSEEKEEIKNEYNLTDEEVNKIWESYYLDYRDKGIVGTVFKSVEELGEEEVDIFLDMDDRMKKYFNFEEFGNDLIDNENYVLLESGEVVTLNY